VDFVGGAELDALGELGRDVVAEVGDQGAVLPVIDVAPFDAAGEAAGGAIAFVEERQQQGGHDQEQQEDQAAAVGAVAEHFFVQQGAKDVPAHGPHFSVVCR
jgi:hypothetical protein